MMTRMKQLAVKTIRRFWVALLIIAFVPTAPAAYASDSEPYLVKDISPGVFSSDPNTFVELNGNLLFVADDGIHGYELWKSDGTAAGTQIVKDIWPGVYPTNSQINFVSVLSDTVLFAASDGEHGTELWKSDGTLEGTSPIVRIITSSQFYYTSLIANANGILYFQAVSDQGSQLWRSDGSLEGTFVLPGSEPDGSLTVELGSVEIRGDTVFFFVNDGIHGAELWKSNGTVAGTVLVKDIRSGPDSSDGSIPYDMVLAGNTLFFTADDGIHGKELWMSDGTPEGTRLVKDIWTGEYPSHIRYLVAARERVFFMAEDGIHSDTVWTSDGTPEGTMIILDVAEEYFYQIVPRFFRATGDLLLFQLNDEMLWKSDGTPAGTLPFKQVGVIYDALSGLSDPLYFSTSSAMLWRSNGTPDGTYPLVDLLTGTDIRLLGGDKDSFYFTAASYEEAPCPIWRGDGTAVGTIPITTAYPHIELPEDPECSGIAKKVNETLFFRHGDEAHGVELWIDPNYAEPNYEEIAGLSVTTDGPTVLGNTSTFTASITAGNFVRYTWSYADPDPYTDEYVTGSTFMHHFVAPGVYTVTVTARNAISELSATTEVTVQKATRDMFMPVLRHPVD